MGFYAHAQTVDTRPLFPLPGYETITHCTVKDRTYLAVHPCNCDFQITESSLHNRIKRHPDYMRSIDNLCDGCSAAIIVAKLILFTDSELRAEANPCQLVFTLSF